jgi:Flp pilus assembly protein TadG
VTPRPGIVWRIAHRVRRPLPGQAAIEFALILPVLVLLGLLTVDVGRVTFDYIGLRNAAMEGAIYGALHPGDTSAAAQRVRDHFLPNPVPPGLAVTVTAEASCSQLTSTDADPSVSVTVTREFRPVSLVALQSLAPGTDWILTVQSTANARCMT